MENQWKLQEIGFESSNLILLRVWWIFENRMQQFYLNLNGLQDRISVLEQGFYMYLMKKSEGGWGREGIAVIISKFKQCGNKPKRCRAYSYHKIPKYSDTPKFAVINLKFEQDGFTKE